MSSFRLHLDGRFRQSEDRIKQLAAEMQALCASCSTAEGRGEKRPEERPKAIDTAGQHGRRQWSPWSLRASPNLRHKEAS